MTDIDFAFTSCSPSDAFFFILWAVTQCEDLGLKLQPNIVNWVKSHVVIGAVVKPYLALLHPHKGSPEEFLQARRAYTESTSPEHGRRLLYERADKGFCECGMRCRNCPVLSPSYTECRTCASLGLAAISAPQRYIDRELVPLITSILLNNDTAIYIPEPDNAETISALAQFLGRVWRKRVDVCGISDIIRRSSAETLAESPMMIVYGVGTENQKTTVRSAATSRAFAHKRTIVLTRESATDRKSGGQR